MGRPTFVFFCIIGLQYTQAVAKGQTIKMKDFRRTVGTGKKKHRKREFAWFWLEVLHRQVEQCAIKSINWFSSTRSAIHNGIKIGCGRHAVKSNYNINYDNGQI